MAYSVSALEAFNLSMKRTIAPYFTVVLCCCLTLSVTACGQRGPLYLPEKETEAQGSETEPAAKENSEEEDETNT
jgi:predicted small lipoprotein YifL